jgi:hypothetical protein
LSEDGQQHTTQKHYKEGVGTRRGEAPKTIFQYRTKLKARKDLATKRFLPDFSVKTGEPPRPTPAERKFHPIRPQFFKKSLKYRS